MSRLQRPLWPLLAAVACGSIACADGSFAGVYFVKLNAHPASVVALADEIAREVGAEPIHVFDAATAGFTLKLPHLAAPELERLEPVDYVVLDPATKRLPPNTTGWPVSEVDPQEVSVSVERVGGPLPWVVDWDDVEVAIVDTGIDASHSDLNVVAHRDFVAMRGGGHAGPSGDPVGHGTHVAGIVGARDNGSGMVGLAPGVPLHDLRVLGADGTGYSSDILAAVDYILETPRIKVANFSLGGGAGSGMDRALQQAFSKLEDAGVVVVVAAGNEASPASTSVPAAFDVGLIVSAYDAAAGDRGFAGFSNYGEEVDIAAPGVAIRSTWPGGGEAELDGTSMAAPHVTGAAAGVAVLLAGNDDIQAVYDALLDGAENGVRGENRRHPEPMLDAASAWEVW